MASVLVIAASLLAGATSQPGDWNGCWEGGVYDIEIPNCTPKPPASMCSNCPLLVDNVYDGSEEDGGEALKGQFKDCTFMFDTLNDACGADIKLYIDNTPCDTHTINAYENIWGEFKDTADEEEKRYSQQVLDRVVYNACEYCCDAIPCGVEDKTYEVVQNTTGLWLIDVRRRNSPLHLHADNCGMYPDLEVELEGDDGEVSQTVQICPILKAWKGASGSAQDDLLDELVPLMGKLAKDYGCHAEPAWTPCAIMEHRMERLTVGHKNC